MITGKNIIGFKASALGKNTFKTFNSTLNKENDWLIYEATDEEVEFALDLASKAFVEYRKVPDEQRAQFLYQIAENIEALGDDLLDVYSKESSLSLGRAKIERARTVQQLKLYADYILSKQWKDIRIVKGDQNRKSSPKPDLRKTYIPLGPVVVFGASNFPLAYSTAGGDTATALAAACPVIVKSHPMHAGTGEMVARAIQKAAEQLSMPEGVFSNLNHSGIELGQELVMDERIKAIGFTGSIRGGRALMDIVAKRKTPIPIFAEMGSVNPVFISPASLKKEKGKWVSEYARSITNGVGQFCTNPGLIIGIDSPALDEFAEDLGQELLKIEAQPMLHPSIYKSYESRKSENLSIQGADVILQKKLSKPNYARQAVASIEANIFLKHDQLQEEVFGPFSLIIKCEDIHQVLSVIHHLNGQLSGTVILDDSEIEKYNSVIEALELKVGRIIFNGVPTGVEVNIAQHHGGPYPASSDSRFTAVGEDAIKRWVRPITYQNFPSDLLPEELR